MSEADRDLGHVTMPGGGVATLRADRTWSVPGQEWIEPSYKLFYSDAYRGPQDGPFGPGALNALARDVGGVATIRERPGKPDETDVGAYLGARLEAGEVDY